METIRSTFRGTETQLFWRRSLLLENLTETFQVGLFASRELSRNLFSIASLPKTQQSLLEFRNRPPLRDRTTLAKNRPTPGQHLPCQIPDALIPSATRNSAESDSV
jgi:hypothetical protein